MIRRDNRPGMRLPDIMRASAPFAVRCWRGRIGSFAHAVLDLAHRSQLYESAA